MPKPIDVLFVASEADPFVKTGCIGELAGSLPKTLKALGHDIRVMLPGYSSISNRRFQIHNLLRMKDISVPVSDQLQHAYIRSSYLSSVNQKVLVYFLANDKYFDREGLYCHPETKKYFADNDERFIFFCRGVLETLKRLQWQPHIIHCNDWQCGLIPAYLKTLYKKDPYYKNIKTVFTVYSTASYASFPHSSFGKTGLPYSLFKDNGSDSEQLDFLKLGLTFADAITTFGNKTNKELSKSYNNGIGKILNSRKNINIPMNSGNNTEQENLANKLVDIYRDLAKSNG